MVSSVKVVSSVFGASSKKYCVLVDKRVYFVIY
jgi:hypothetical protein